jgi:hypothetical protein
MRQEIVACQQACTWNDLWEEEEGRVERSVAPEQSCRRDAPGGRRCSLVVPIQWPYVREAWPNDAAGGGLFPCKDMVPMEISKEFATGLPRSLELP